MRILRSVGSSDTITARAGLNELNDILESLEKQAALRDYEEIYIENVCLQLRVSRFRLQWELFFKFQSILTKFNSFLCRICHKFLCQMPWLFINRYFQVFTHSTHHERLARMLASNH